MNKLSLCIAVLVLLAPAARAEDIDLDELRLGLDKYQDVNVALADGYIPDPSGHCITAAMEGLPPEFGAMGLHYIRPNLLQITGADPRVDGTGTYTDWSQPAVLLYEPQADGSLVLVGVENVVFEKAWTEAGNSEPPRLNGRSWDHMADDPATDADEAHGFMPHYDQHVWLWRDNPAGELEPFNANVTCPDQAH
jgi:hypothetical protein